MSLSWFEVFANTIEAMIRTAKAPWNAYVEPEGDSTSQAFKSRIRLGQLRGPLQCKHIVSALYKIGLAMAATFHKDQLYAGIVVDGRPIGWIRYELKSPRLEDVPVNSTFFIDGSYSTRSLSTSLPNHSPKSSVSSASGLSVPRSGTVTDPDDPKFSVTYEFEGANVGSAAMFTAFADAIATTARYGNDEIGGSIISYSADRRMAIHLFRDVTSATFTWGDVKSALALIWRKVIIGSGGSTEPRWEDMTIVILYGDKIIGGGYIASYAVPILDPGTVAAN